MSDESEQRRPGVRRVSARDRKRRIEARDLSYPPDESTPSEEIPFEPVAEANEAPTQVLDARRAESASSRRQQVTRPEARRTLPPAPQPSAAPRRRSRRFGWRDLVAALFGFATCGAIAYFVYIWDNPFSVFNPLSPPLPPPLVVSETPLPTSTFTPSPTPTRRPTATFTALPAEALSAAAGSTTVSTVDPTAAVLALTPSATPIPPAFVMRPNRINEPTTYMTNAGGAGCNYAAIAGSVVDVTGEPLNDYVVWITGEDIDSRLISGSDNRYGAGGFLLQIGETPEVQAFAVQLLAPDGVTAVSEPYTFLTRSTCEYNIAIVRFFQVREVSGS